jgi:hypothetical protein
MNRTRSILASLIATIPVFLILASHSLALAQNSPDAPDGQSQPPGQGQTSQDPPSRVARLTQIQGNVSIQPAGVRDWTQATANYPMTTGDRMYVDKDSRAELQMEQTVVHIWQYTDLSVTSLTDTFTQLGLSQGSLHVRTFELNQGHDVEVDTPNGAITVVQPGDFRIDCYTGDGGTVVTVNSGEIDVTGPGLSQSLAAGQSARLMGSNPITLTALSLPGRDPFDVWSQQRDRQLLSSNTRQYVNPNTVGSDDLDQYGTWTDTPGYGSVWYPAAVPAGWVPYSTGSWVWVSPWGWTWVDTYPWGFAPYHYGRWAYYGNRWGWVPGPVAVTPIYSPALVGFVGGPGFSVGIGMGVGLSAWFPLGPGEPYYPWYHCSPGYFSRVNVTNINRITINRITNIHNINNTNYYNYYHNKNTFNTLRFVNRNMATTAVPANQFASGRAITPSTAIRPTPQQMARAQVIPHPFVTPTVRSVVPHPVRSVPVASARRNLITPRYASAPATAAQRSPAGQNHTQPIRPATGRQAPLRTSPAPGSVAPYSERRTYAQPGTGTPRGNLQESAGAPLVTHHVPPSVEPSFAQRQPALTRDPGRPLDPMQLNNINRGRPAGPPRAAEFPPHPAWAPRPNYSAPRGAGPRR